jgi:hypothetical protein
VYAVSRHPLDYDVKRAKHIRLDLSDKEAVKQVCTSTLHACELILHGHNAGTASKRCAFAGPAAGSEG